MLKYSLFFVVLAVCVVPLAALYPYSVFYNQDPRGYLPGYGQQQQLVGLPAAYLAAQQQQQLLRGQLFGQQGYGGYDPSIGWQQQQQQQLLRQQMLQQAYNPYYQQQYGGYGNLYGASGYGGYGGAHYHPGYYHSGPFATRDVSKAITAKKA